jgi:hypothetical protein
MENMHELFNGYIADKGQEPESVALTIAGYTSQQLGRNFPEEERRLQMALSALISLVRRISTGPDYIHAIRLVISQPEKYYGKEFLEPESKVFQASNPRQNFIAVLKACLRTIDPNPHVAGNLAQLGIIPRHMVRPDVWPNVF